MKNLIMILIVVFIYQYKSLSSIDTTYELIPSNEKHKISIYIFAESTSCFTCLESLNYYYNVISNRDVQFILFLNGVAQSNVEYYKKKYDWSFNVIADPLGLYSNYYNIKLLPTYIIFDFQGIMIGEGKCGGEVVIDDILNKAMKDIKEEVISPKIQHLKMIKRIILNDNKKQIITTSKRFLLFSKEKHIYILANSQFNSYHVFDSVGNQIIEIDLKEKNINSYFTFQPQWVDFNSKILGISMDERANRILYYINVISGEISMLKDNYFLNDSLGWNKGTNFLYDIENDQILGTIFPLEPRKLTDKDTLFIITDKFGKQIKKFFLIEDLYREFSISHKYSCSFDRIPSIGYIINITPSEKIYMTNFEGKLIKILSAKLDTTFKKGIYEEDGGIREKSLKELIEMNLNSSTISSLKFDEKTNLINILYFSRVIPESKGNSDISFSDICLQYYLSSIDFNGKKVRDYDIEFPIDIVPFYINGNIIIASEYHNNNLELIWYEIEDTFK